MKKILILFAALILPNHYILCMEDKKGGGSSALGRMATTLYDKVDPLAVLEELRTSGVSQDDDGKITQMHRVDRVVRYRIERSEVAELCDNLTTILTREYPISKLARKRATDYLCNIRPSKEGDATLQRRITETLDILNPAQIIYDFLKGQIFTSEKVELENRVSLAMEQLVTLGDTHNLKQFVAILAARSKEEQSKVLPHKRVAQRAYDLLRAEQKAIETSNKALVEALGAEKSESDTED